MRRAPTIGQVWLDAFCSRQIANDIELDFASRCTFADRAVTEYQKRFNEYGSKK